MKINFGRKMMKKLSENKTVIPVLSEPVCCQLRGAGFTPWGLFESLSDYYYIGLSYNE
jgi:hypothetical protein